MYGVAAAQTGGTTGVWGVVQSTGDGAAALYGTSLAGTGQNFGLFASAQSSAGYGVYCMGRMTATGTKAFQIDHPLDPANKVLNHYSAEGPEPLNVYRGNVTLDAQGRAWVTLPAYFESINKDFTYQLTPVGGPGPGLYIATKVADNKFQIAGGMPNLEVSWCVTGVRNDAWVRANGAPVEQDKPAAIKGRYLAPLQYGQAWESAAYLKVRPITPVEQPQRAE
jgi:hypothetical protein